MVHIRAKRERPAAGLGLFVAATLLLLANAPAAAADFGIESFSSETTDAVGAPYTLAGGHPHRNAIGFSVSLASGKSEPEQSLNGTYLMPAPGFIANPAAASRCRIALLVNDECPLDSRVGFAEVTLSGGLGTHALYNLVPERGFPAQFGFQIESGSHAILSVFPQARSEAYGLTLAAPNIPAGSGASALRASLCGFGVEGDGIDPDGDGPALPDDPLRCRPASGLAAPFLTNPLDCSLAAPSASIALDSLEHAGALREPGVPDLNDPDWQTASFIVAPVSGCDRPALAAQFDPAIAIEPLQAQAPGPTEADQPAGLRVGLTFPQSNDPTATGTEFDPETPQAPAPREITVRLPSGLTFSAAGADGLGACSDRADDPAGDQVHYEATRPVSCPDAAKIGSATAFSPLLASRNPGSDEVLGPEPIPGEVYLLKPHPGDLPGGGAGEGRFRLLIELESPRHGVNVKLPGIATADRDSGRVTATFTEAPQLPASRLTIELKSGPRAPLATPPTCGAFTTTSTLVPWSAPGTPDAHPSASFAVGSGPGGGACPDAAAGRPFAPRLQTAGSDSARAGAASPFTLELTRADGDQGLDSVSFTAPPGFSAKLKGVGTCPDTAIAAARAKSGAQEQAEPSCPAASRLGTLTAGAGPGSNPYYAQGSAYLAGPYKGAPLSFAFITPALAGPFDLGNVVFRAGAYLDPTTAQVTVKTDELPRIWAGVPLRLRSVAIRLDRPDFTRNPTDCEPSAVSARVEGSDGASARPTAYFQVGGCKGLRFRPRVALSFLDNLARNGHPAVRAALRAGPGEAGIAATTITLPRGELLDLRRLGTLCPRGLPLERCPRSARIGSARAWSPLLAEPLRGPIYLREPEAKMPALIADLRGGGLRFHLRGQTSAAAGRLRFRFPALPDAPLSRALVTLAGGERGIFANSESLCRAPRRAAVALRAHNGDRRQLHPRIRLPGGC